MKLSSIGFGSYRVNFNDDEHFNALYKLLTCGINLIDTSANYYNGGSEVLIGNVISKLIAEGKLERKNLTLITKVGYIQGQISHLQSNA